MPRRIPAIDGADLAMLLVVFIWSVNNVITKAVLNERLLPLTYVALRFILVALLLGGWLLYRNQIIRIDRQDWPRLIFSGLTGYGLANMLWVFGISRTSAFMAAIIAAMSPVFTLLFAAVLHIEKVRRVQWIGVLLAFAGVTLFVGEKLAGGNPAIGDLFNLLSAASFACYNLTMGPLVRKYGSPVTAFWSVLVSLVVVIPLALPSLFRQNWQEIGSRGWIAVFYAAAFSMLGGYILWSWAISQRGAARIVPFMFLVPIMTGVLSYLFLDERFSLMQMLGTMLVIGGVFLALEGARRSALRELPGAVE